MVCISGRSKSVFRPLGLLLLLVVFSALNGCGINLERVNFSKLFSKKSPTINKTAKQLAVMGMANLKKRKFSEAAQDFKKLKEEYPYSKYAILAGLKLGDAYFGEQKYVESAMSYEEFARLHPRNAETPYVLYQAGMSHFLMFTATDRDPRETKKAIETFRKVIENFPKSEYAAKSEKQLLECKKRLACHVLCVAKQYYISGYYFAAKSRLDTLRQKYPEAIADLGYGPRVQKMLAKCNKEVAKGPRKPDFWTRVGF